MIARNNRFRRNGRKEKQVCGTSCCKNGYGRKLSLETLEDRRVLALVGVAPLDYPTIDYNVDGFVTYDNASDSYLIDATPSIYTPSMGGGPGFFFNGDLKINIQVDDTGALIGGAPGDDLLITGDVDIDGDFVVDYSGVLLTGEVAEFGYQDSGSTTDTYDFRFTVTGGALAAFYAGKDLGVVATSENSSFVGDFTIDFGGKVKGQVGAIEPENDQPASLSGHKFTDITGDGVSGDDTPLAGVTINLYQDTGALGVLDGESVYQSDVTDVNGEYSFSDLPAGDYIVQEVVPAGYVATSPVFYALSLGAGDNVDTGYDFSNTELGSITGVKLAEITECECDKYGNTTESTVIDPLAGVTINLYLDNGTTPGVLDGGDTFVDSDVTDIDGEYFFGNVLPGSYLVQEEVPAGYLALTPIVVATNVTSGSDVTDIDFLNKLVKASVGNYFFIDSNSNGIQDIGDFGVNGVTVKLLNQSGSVIETTVTASDGSGNAGYYLFYDLNAGNYMIEFEVPVGVQFTIKDVAGNSNNTLDSDVNSNGRTDLFALAANQHRRDIDAGVKPEVMIESVVYKVKDYFDKCQQSKAGIIKGVTLEYSDTSDELLVQVTLASYQGRIADGFTIVIDDGSSIGDQAGSHAIFYFDATGASPILSVLAYNGDNDGSSIRDSNGNTRSYDPDRIATSLDNSTGWVKELSVVTSGSKKVMTFKIDVGAINDHVPMLRKINWQGSEIGKYASFVVDTFDGLTTRYDSTGFLTKWSFCYHGWADACKIKTEKCVVKETIAIDEFFEEWGWEVSEFTGNSDGDPLNDILWAGSADACQADKDCNRCDGNDHHYSNDCDWNFFKMFSCKLSSRC
jgi:5-hydroxyisourate hydrolase-like protein (transthyretin family)